MRKLILIFFLIILNIENSFAGNKFASLLIDGSTGKIIIAERSKELRHPASLTKLMTLYLTFIALESKQITLNDKITISKHAASQPYSTPNLLPTDKISVKDAIDFIIVKSSNSSAVSLAEIISQSEPNFVKLMNNTAKQLGMHNTNFENATGFYHKTQYATAEDLARLALAIQYDFPQYFHLFKKNNIKYNNKIHKTHNKLLLNNNYVTGLKTGYIKASGYNLISTAAKNNNELIAIVLGGKKANMRDKIAHSLLNVGFSKLDEPNYKQKQLITLTQNNIDHQKRRRKYKPRTLELSNFPQPNKKPVGFKFSIQVTDKYQ